MRACKYIRTHSSISNQSLILSHIAFLLLFLASTSWRIDETFDVKWMWSSWWNNWFENKIINFVINFVLFIVQNLRRIKSWIVSKTSSKIVVRFNWTIRFWYEIWNKIKRKRFSKSNVFNAIAIIWRLFRLIHISSFRIDVRK